jgi:hypothetical protein
LTKRARATCASGTAGRRRANPTTRRGSLEERPPDTTTLPLWILGAFRNTKNVPEVNAAATVILAISLPMIAAAAYLMREEGGTGRRGQE